jgi:hypothetical protein
MRARVGLRLYTAGSGFCRPGCLCSELMLGLGVWPVGLAPNPGPCGHRLLVYAGRARALAWDRRSKRP